MRWIWIALLSAFAGWCGERQLTHSTRVHALDNNDNFSFDDRFLCFDTRENEIWKVDVATGEETLLYGNGPKAVAVSFHPSRDEVIFIHGPFDGEYFKSNRRGATVGQDGVLRFLDERDTTSLVTRAGAHRGGTHRHEYSLDGRRVGFTYDDQLLPAYGRTIAMVQDGRFVVLVPVVPEGSAKAGELVMASGDSWVGAAGRMRAFIGRVKEYDGSFRNSLFVVDVPADLDLTTAFAGDRNRFPTPPKGVKVRRLTTSDTSGIVRGSRDGKFVAYLASGEDGAKQLFVIPSAGGIARQVSQIPGGVQGGVRWHPAGNYLAAITARGVIAVELATGKVKYLTEKGGDALVWSNDGKTLAFNRKVGSHLQIFLVPFNAHEF